MGERGFQKHEDARMFARDTAVATKSLTRIYYSDGLWMVEGKTVSPLQVTPIHNSSVIVQDDVANVILKIREMLMTSEDVGELLYFLDVNYKKISGPNGNSVSLLSESDQGLYRKLPQILTDLSSASDAVEDLSDVKSKEHATEMIYKFQELSIAFSDYAISRCMRRHKQSMLEASTKLKSENVAKRDAMLGQAISRLESAVGQCKCGKGRMVIKDGSYGYFWGCSSFPSCFYKRSLTKSEMDSLSV